MKLLHYQSSDNGTSYWEVRLSLAEVLPVEDGQHLLRCAAILDFLHQTEIAIDDLWTTPIHSISMILCIQPRSAHDFLSEYKENGKRNSRPGINIGIFETLHSFVQRAIFTTASRVNTSNFSLL